MRFKMSFTSLVATALLSVACLADAGTSSNLSTGYYFGWGDSASLALHVKTDNQFTVYDIQGVGAKNSPHYFKYNGTSNSGTLKRLGPGHYMMLFNITPYEHKKCAYSLRYKPKYEGWSLRSLNKACVWYHGTSWGYGTVSNKHLLKKGD